MSEMSAFKDNCIYKGKKKKKQNNNKAFSFIYNINILYCEQIYEDILNQSPVLCCNLMFLYWETEKLPEQKD